MEKRRVQMARNQRCGSVRFGSFPRGSWFRPVQVFHAFRRSQFGPLPGSLPVLVQSGSGPVRFWFSLVPNVSFHGTMVPWYHGTVAPWYHGTMVMVPWYHGTMVPWYHGSMEPWNHCTMVPWCHGAMVPWHHGTMSHAPMVPWCHGTQP